jgi:hypothetical protein
MDYSQYYGSGVREFILYGKTQARHTQARQQTGNEVVRLAQWLAGIDESRGGPRPQDAPGGKNDQQRRHVV